MSKHRECRVCVCTFGGAFLVLWLAGSPAARAGSYNFVTLDAGGPYQTLLYGINNNGVVTGIAQNPNNNYYGTGVIFNAGVPTLVSMPGAVDTEFYQINTAGQIAASYYASDGIYHAAVYTSSNSSWSNLPDVPGYAEDPVRRHRQPWGGIRRSRSSISSFKAVWDGPGTGVATRSSARRGRTPLSWGRRPTASTTPDRSWAISRMSIAASSMNMGTSRQAPTSTTLDACPARDRSYTSAQGSTTWES